MKIFRQHIVQRFTLIRRIGEKEALKDSHHDSLDWTPISFRTLR